MSIEKNLKRVAAGVAGVALGYATYSGAISPDRNDKGSAAGQNPTGTPEFTASPTATLTLTPTLTETPTFTGTPTLAENVSPSAAVTEKTVALATTSAPTKTPTPTPDTLYGWTTEIPPSGKDEMLSLNATYLELSNPATFKENVQKLKALREAYPAEFDALNPLFGFLMDTPDEGVVLGIDQMNLLKFKDFGLGFGAVDVAKLLAANSKIDNNIVFFDDEAVTSGNPRLGFRKDPTAIKDLADILIPSSEDTLLRSAYFFKGADNIAQSYFIQSLAAVEQVLKAEEITDWTPEQKKYVAARLTTKMLQGVRGEQEVVEGYEPLLMQDGKRVIPVKGLNGRSLAFPKVMFDTRRVQKSPDEQSGNPADQGVQGICVRVRDRGEGLTPHNELRDQGNFVTFFVTDINGVVTNEDWLTPDELVQVLARYSQNVTLHKDDRGYSLVSTQYEVSPTTEGFNSETILEVACGPVIIPTATAVRIIVTPEAIFVTPNDPDIPPTIIVTSPPPKTPDTPPTPAPTNQQAPTIEDTPEGDPTDESTVRPTDTTGTGTDPNPSPGAPPTVEPGF